MSTFSVCNFKEKCCSACNQIHETDRFVKQLMELLLEYSKHSKRNIKSDNRVQ